MPLRNDLRVHGALLEHSRIGTPKATFGRFLSQTLHSTGPGALSKALRHADVLPGLRPRVAHLAKPLQRRKERHTAHPEGRSMQEACAHQQTQSLLIAEPGRTWKTSSRS